MPNWTNDAPVRNAEASPRLTSVDETEAVCVASQTRVGGTGGVPTDWGVVNYQKMAFGSNKVAHFIDPT
jgi:hypothetical protein